MIRRPPRSTQSRSSAASDVYKRQVVNMKAWQTLASLPATLDSNLFALVSTLIRAVPEVPLACQPPSRRREDLLGKIILQPLFAEIFSDAAMNLVPKNSFCLRLEDYFLVCPMPRG